MHSDPLLQKYVHATQNTSTGHALGTPALKCRPVITYFYLDVEVYENYASTFARKACIQILGSVVDLNCATV
jgi:hypothetical protein